jgi:hypothetical protein
MAGPTAWLGQVSVDGIVPEPMRVETDRDRLVWVFDTDDGVVEATVHLQPGTVGILAWGAGLDGGDAVRLAQVVFP